MKIELNAKEIAELVELLAQRDSTKEIETIRKNLDELVLEIDGCLAHKVKNRNSSGFVPIAQVPHWEDRLVKFGQPQ